jgi:hypothetical protein
MGMVINRLLEMTALRHRGPARCVWARSRFHAYYAWAPGLSRRHFRAIEQHLNACSACRDEYQQVHETWNVLEGSLSAGNPRLLPVDALCERVAARIRASERWNVHPGTLRRPALARKWACLAAAGLTLMLVAPIWAHLGARSENPRQTAPVADKASSPPPTVGRTAQEGVPTFPQTDSPAQYGAEAPLPAYASGVDASVQRAAASALIAASLPQTDRECEAWARESFPHIMALYDILTAQRLPDESGQSAEQRFAALVPKGLPEDVRACLLRLAAGAAQCDGPLWDGTPCALPEWAERLYAGTPESQRADGWRALLLYSGVIFAFDFPRSLHEPNVVPQRSDLQKALAVCGLPTLCIHAAPRPACCEADGRNRDLPSGYPDLLAADTPLAHSVIVHVCVVDELANTNEFRGIADMARTFLAELPPCGEESCNARNLASALRRVLTQHLHATEAALATETSSQYP